MTNRTDRLRRNTTFAVVERIVAIRPHRDPRMTRIEVIELSSGISLVTGKHYREGDRGIYLRPGCLIPGLLAEQLWMVGKQRATAWFEVRDIAIGLRDAPDDLKEPSPGLWAGEWYRHDGSPESAQKAAEHGEEVDADGYVHWKYWRPDWREGFCLDGHFGIVESEPTAYVIVGGANRAVAYKHDPAYVARKHSRPRSSTGEQPVSNRKGAVPRGIAFEIESIGPTFSDASSTPAVGSLPQEPEC